MQYGVSEVAERGPRTERAGRSEDVGSFGGEQRDDRELVCDEECEGDGAHTRRRPHTAPYRGLCGQMADECRQAKQREEGGERLAIPAKKGIGKDGKEWHKGGQSNTKGQCEPKVDSEGQHPPAHLGRARARPCACRRWRLQQEYRAEHAEQSKPTREHPARHGQLHVQFGARRLRCATAAVLDEPGEDEAEQRAEHSASDAGGSVHGQPWRWRVLRRRSLYVQACEATHPGRDANSKLRRHEHKRGRRTLRVSRRVTDACRHADGGKGERHETERHARREPAAQRP
mmetsp:Transcript_22854/g.58115  ORF Transcript_22854/g.58115 Transcript_22854/m.58115 type:complete len:287 (+) Transcript_22854:462-1322(+)